MFTDTYINTENILTSFPPEQSAKITHLIHSIGKRYGAATESKQKQLGTHNTRVQHYIRFCTNVMGMDPRLSDLTEPDQTLIAIIYLAHLTEGHTHKGFRVRYETLKGYMDAMSAYVQEFGTSA